MADPSRPRRERVARHLSKIKHTVKQFFRPSTPEPSTHASVAPVIPYPTNPTEQSEQASKATSSISDRVLVSPTNDAPKDSSRAAATEQVASVAKYSACAIPVLGPALDMLSALLLTVPTAARNHAEYEQLRSSISTSIDGLQRFMGTCSSREVSETITSTVEELAKQTDEIGDKQRRGSLSSYLEADADIDDLLQRYRKIQDVLQRLQLHASLATWKATNENMKMVKDNLDISRDLQNDARMKKLQPALAAKYDSHASSQVHRTGCTPGTRQQILQQLVDWAQDPQGARIYWMNGMAGTGKTTIAYSLCKTLKATSQLAASFFCSRSLPDCRDVSRIAPTVAYQLAQCSWPYQQVLCRVIGDDPDVAQSDIKTQWDTLIAKPLKQVESEIPSGLLVVVIDALDECLDRQDASRVLRSLLEVTAELPVKYFVTCRPDSGSLGTINKQSDVVKKLYHLHNVEDSLVQADIHRYLAKQLHDNATPKQIDQLAARAGRLFIFAATVVRYVSPEDPDVDHVQRLRKLLMPASTAANMAHAELDKLYAAILSGTLGANRLDEDEKTNMKLVLDTVVCAREPLTAGGLAGLLSLQSTDQARHAIQPLRAVLFVDDRSELVTVLHASFADYMLDSARAQSFVCHEAEHDRLLAERCFGVMRDLLAFNMARLASSFVLDQDIPDLPARRDEATPTYLAYACRSWSAHATRAHGKDDVLGWVYEMLQTKAMYWLEAMNLMGCTPHAARMLSEAYTWMTSNSGVEEQVVGLCQDAYSFATSIAASPAHLSTPHIYVSVLALWDKRRPMWTHYGARLQGHVKVEGPAVDNRQSGGLAAWKVDSPVYSVAVSEDGRHIATGSLDGRVRVWDASNGSLVTSAAVIHDGYITSVTFSPDDTRVASGSQDGTIRVCDTMTGAVIGNHCSAGTGIVKCVVYTPDSTRFVSGHEDGSVCVWDAISRLAVLGPLQGHTSVVISVACAPKGHRFVSGSGDTTLRIWDINTSETLLGPLSGHTNAVWSVAYSPDGAYIVSGSLDRTIRIWDPDSGTCVGTLSDAHAGGCRSVSISSDSKRIVSGSYDQTVCVWDMATRQLVAGPFRGHTDRVYSAVFTPDGRRVVSGSEDGTVRVWDAHAASTLASPSYGHAGGVTSVSFSPDSRLVASGSEDGTVCVWNARTGQIQVGPFRKHTGTVCSVTFSPNGNCVVSGSWDRTVRIWNIIVGDEQTQVCRGHTSWVQSVSVCPDGTRVASGSYDKTVRVWDVHTGLIASGPFTGHTDQVMSVAYSPDGHRIVSGSADKTVRVWDAHTGDTLLGPLRGHTNWVMSVAYSPRSDRIVSGSADCTIRVWDAQTGDPVFEPLTGHTGAVRSVAYSPDCRHLLSGSEDWTIQVWDALSGKAVAGPFSAHSGFVRSAAFSPDGQLIASGSNDGAIRVWDRHLCMTAASSSKLWTVDGDGWVMSNGVRIVWLPTELRTGLQWPHHVAFVHAQGDCRIDFEDAYVGEQWARCYNDD